MQPVLGLLLDVQHPAPHSGVVWLPEEGVEVASASPELFLSRYFCQVEDHRFFQLAEPIPGPSTTSLGALAKELGVVIIASLFEKRAEGLYHNTTAILDADGKYLGKYRKMHIPDDPNYYEKFYFTPGDLGFRSWDTQHAKAGVLICWDQWYPEAARLTALTGAQILFYPTAIGWLIPEKAEYGATQQASWETIRDEALRLRTASTWWPSTGSVRERAPTRGSSSGWQLCHGAQRRDHREGGHRGDDRGRSGHQSSRRRAHPLAVFARPESGCVRGNDEQVFG
jgi:hypothetical protein